MKQVELARELGVSRSYISMLAKGKRQPSKKLQKKIQKLTSYCSLPAMSGLLPKQDVEGSNPFTRSSRQCGPHSAV